MFRHLLCILHKLLLCGGVSFREQGLALPVEDVYRVDRHFYTYFN